MWFWIWTVLVVLALATFVGLGIWLAHKAADLFHELGAQSRRAQELVALMEQLDLEPSGDRLAGLRGRTATARRPGPRRGGGRS